MASLQELDTLEILVLVDNELDPLSPCQTDLVQQSGSIKDIAMREPRLENNQSFANEANIEYDLRMKNICHAAHGTSLLISAVRGDKKRILLMDGGPEASVLEENVKRLRADMSQVEHIHLTHWHADHSAGLPKALDLIHSARDSLGLEKKVVPVDLHPRRPFRRGNRLPDMPLITMQEDPTWEAIQNEGGELRITATEHTVLDNGFLISGEIPRLTPYERGLEFAVAYNTNEQAWEPDEAIVDERLLMCRLKGKGLVMFTGCSHAGVVNASRHAVELGSGVPLYAVVGGLHLVHAGAEQLSQTMEDLAALGVKLVLAGHCTGWRAKFELEKAMPGRLVPLFVGSQYKMT